MRTMLKLHIILTINLFFSILACGQLITTNPEFPVPGQSVTIHYDATEGNQELMGYTGEVYAHTGLITENSVSGSDWRYVIADWNNNTPKALMTRISTDYYQLNITPDIFTFYNCPQTEEIMKMAFVFRSSDGSLVGREADGSDIFVQVYNQTNEIIITSPDSLQIFSPNEDIIIDAVSLFATSMELFINDTLIDTFFGNQIEYIHNTNYAGYNNIEIKATDGADTVTKHSRFFIRNEVQTAALPFPGLKDGINYIDDNSVVLVLYAPEKEFVFVNGSFNNWELSLANQMYKTNSGKRFWIQLNGLSPTTEYAFQYNIDGNIIIADPYAEKILDPWNDQYISEQTYPDLMPYPHGTTQGIVSVFQINKPEYNWNIQNFTPPPREGLIIYELLIRDFIDAHNYQTLTDTLDYLDSLGINAIELMPVNEFEGNSSWGYNPSFYFAPDKYYGTENALKAFIDACHHRGIAVIMDMVLNHSYGQSPLVQMYFEAGAPAVNNPWYNRTSPNPVYAWGYDFNHESEDTKNFVSRVLKYWLEEYRFDGFRLDFTKGFTNTPGDGSGFDASRIAILKQIADTVWSVNSDAYVILEHFADNSEEKVLTAYGMMVWGNLNHSYCQTSMGHVGESDFSNISYKKRTFTYPHLVGYMESHDEERQMFKNITWGNQAPGYNVTDKNIALKRAELTAILFFTIPGPKMIWQFEELGYDYSIDYDCRVCEKPIRWDYFREEERNRLYQFFKEIIGLKNQYEVFSTSDFTMDVSSYIKEIRLSGENMNAWIMGNMDVVPRQIALSNTASEYWYDYFTSDTINSSVDTLIMLQAGEYRLFTSEKINTPQLASCPEAFNVKIKGLPKVNNTLEAEYRYFDLNGDEESQSVFQWFWSSDGSYLNAEPIDGATQRTYQPRFDDAGSYLFFQIQPVSEGNVLKNGMPAKSDMIGPVENISSELHLFPNPFINEFTVLGIEDFEKISIYNILGQKFFEIEINGQSSMDFFFPELRCGLYLMEFSGRENIKTKKLFKR